MIFAETSELGPPGQIQEGLMTIDAELLVDSASCSIVESYNATDFQPVEIKAYFAQMGNLRDIPVSKLGPEELRNCIRQYATISYARKKIATQNHTIQDGLKIRHTISPTCNRARKRRYAPIRIN